MSGKLKEVRTRIGSVKSTQQITKAMKLVAASKLKRAQERITKMRPYSRKLNSMLSNIVSGVEGDFTVAYAVERPVHKALVLLVTSDRGLCGGFNSNVSKLITRDLLKKELKSLSDSGDVELMCIGKKGYDVLKREVSNLSINTDNMDLFGRLSFDESAKVAEGIMSDFLEGKYDAVYVVYNMFKNQITQIPTVERFLPISKIQGKPNQESTAIKSGMKDDFIYEPDQAEILKALVPKILKTQFFRFLLDSNASEQGARMTAMDNATENAEELLKELKLTFNRARQAAITTEITEIVSGAAALEG